MYLTNDLLVILLTILKNTVIKKNINRAAQFGFIGNKYAGLRFLADLSKAVSAQLLIFIIHNREESYRNVEKRSTLTPNRWVVSGEHLLTILDPKDLLILCGKDLKTSSK